MSTIGFIGLGAMGSRIAGRLLDAGHDVYGTNRTRAKAAAADRTRPAAGATRRARSPPRRTSSSAWSPTTRARRDQPPARTGSSPGSGTGRSTST